MWSNVLVDPRWTTLQITVVGLLYFKSFIVTALRAESSQISISPLIKPNMGRCGLIFAIKMSNYVISRIQAVHVLSGISHQTAMIERDWLWRMTPSDLQESLEDILTFSFFFPPNAMLIFFSLSYFIKWIHPKVVRMYNMNWSAALFRMGARFGYVQRGHDSTVHKRLTFLTRTSRVQGFPLVHYWQIHVFFPGNISPAFHRKTHLEFFLCPFQRDF